MYFSYHYDLTNSTQRSAKHRGYAATLYDISDKQYVWNQAMCKELMSAGVSTKWLTPIIQGYVGIIEDEIRGKTAKLILISRRRHKRAGTRFNARGIDDDGNVANMVETEQVLLYNNNTYSFVQIRGSVPVFWNQTGVMAAINLTRNPDMAIPAFSRHIDQLVELYKHVLVFNLLSASKEGEAKLTKAFERSASIYEKKENANLRYSFFDFHAQRAANASVVVLLFS